MNEKKCTDDERDEAFDRGMETMQRVALELYRRGREPLLEELEAVKRERDQARDKYEALAVLVDGYRRERDEARDEVERLRREIDAATSELAHMHDEYTRIRSADADQREMTMTCVMLVKERDEARNEVDRLRRELERAGSRECDAPACNCGAWHHREHPRAVYRRGAEAMREACIAWARAPEIDWEALPDVLEEMPIPEEP
jgi:chromosome segregation ATPase